MAEEKGLELKIDVDPALPNHLKGDEIRIKQAVTNILSNAVKYTKEGTITFGLGFETVPEDESSVLLKFSVKDTGVGIKKENVSKLFEAFERLDKIENRSIEGTGLGIPITQSLLRLMGSTLEVESEYGVGSTFSFALKQEVKNWEGVGDFEKSFIKGITGRRTYREKFIAPDAKILVVDDAPVNLTVFKNLLKATKMQIDSAGSADECIEMTKKSKYDMIFLDHMMPEKDGIEALREIKAMADNPNIETPAVCLTANAISGMREMYLAEGFDDYLTKPIDSGDLEECIIRHLTLEKILPPVTKKGYISDKIVVNLPKQLSAEDLTEIFKKLRNLLDNNDYNEVAAIGEMLGNSDIPESEKQRVEMIRSAISNFDYDDVYNFI